MAESEILSLPNFYLELSLDGSSDPVDGIFKECSGFKVTQETIEVCEVTPQKWGREGQANQGRVVRTKIPGNMTYTNMILRKGPNVSRAFWTWLEKVQTGSWSDQRRDGALILYDTASQERFRMEFKRAWPVSYKISDPNVEASGFQVEEVEVTVEELLRVEPVEKVSPGE
ncbi:MAG: phage tail protein [Okeania sp. SIO2D1]|nr:phage tail protein [Okeania sp. SIO2D1]